MSPARRRLAIAAAFLALTVAVVVHASGKEHGVIEDNWVFAGRVLQGAFPYDPTPEASTLHAPYPPSYGIVMGPLWLLPIPAARVVWALLQMAMLGWLWALCQASYRLRWGRPAPVWVAVAALFVVFRYFWRDTAGGGGNLVFGTLVLAACLRPGEAPGTDRRPWLGLGLGVVLAAKPTPLLFLPWLALRGRWRTLLVAVGAALVLHASPLLTYGVEGYARAYGRWLEGTWLYLTRPDVFAEPALGFPPFTWMNQCLRCAMARFLGEVPAEHVLPSSLFLPGLGWSSDRVAWAYRAVAAALVAVTFTALWRRRRAPSQGVEHEACCQLVVLTLLLSPVTWKSYHVLLLPAFYWLLANQRIAACAVYFVVCGLLSEMVLGKGGKNVMQSLYVVTAGALWVWWAMRQTLPSAPAQQEQSLGAG